MDEKDLFIVTCDGSKIEETMTRFIDKLSIKNEIEDIYHELKMVSLNDGCLVRFSDPYHITDLVLPEGCNDYITIPRIMFNYYVDSYEPGTSFYYHLEQTHMMGKDKQSYQEFEEYWKSKGIDTNATSDDKTFLGGWV